MSVLQGSTVSVAVGAADGVAASADINAGRAQTQFFARSALVQGVAAGIGLYGAWFDKRPGTRAWTDPLLFSGFALTARSLAFMLAGKGGGTSAQVQGFTARADTAVNSRVGEITPPTIFVYGPAHNPQRSQAGGLL